MDRYRNIKIIYIYINYAVYLPYRHPNRTEPFVRLLFPQSCERKTSVSPQYHFSGCMMNFRARTNL
uniref:Putative ovule protein n=1 Tax=Solanum chacoense TaxID=4108 RepID=A0A0V0IEA8_SOLCH